MVAAPFVERTTSLFNFLDICVEINVNIYFWVLNSVSLIYMSVLMPVPQS